MSFIDWARAAGVKYAAPFLVDGRGLSRRVVALQPLIFGLAFGAISFCTFVMSLHENLSRRDLDARLFPQHLGS